MNKFEPKAIKIKCSVFFSFLQKYLKPSAAVGNKTPDFSREK